MTHQYKSNKLKETNSSLSQDDLKSRVNGSNSMIVKGGGGGGPAAAGYKRMQSDTF